MKDLINADPFNWFYITIASVSIFLYCMSEKSLIVYLVYKNEKTSRTRSDVQDDQDMVMNVLESVCYRLPASIDMPCENFVKK